MVSRFLIHHGWFSSELREKGGRGLPAGSGGEAGVEERQVPVVCLQKDIFAPTPQIHMEYFLVTQSRA